MKRKFKLGLDIVMLLATLTLFSKSLISMTYHEVAGLVLVGLCLLHILLNAATLAAMTKKFARVPAAVKLGLVVDILLMLCYGFMGLSGVMISKTILTGISAQSMVFRLGHTFAAALSVVLLGVHIGLHICRRRMNTAVAVALTAAVVCAGVWGVVCSNETRWLTAPFAASSAAQRPAGGEGLHTGGQGNGQGFGNGQGKGQGNGNGHGNGQGMGQGNGQGQGMGMGHGMEAASPLERLESPVMFAGMVLTCSMVTYWLALPRRKKAGPAAPAPTSSEPTAE